MSAAVLRQQRHLVHGGAAVTAATAPTDAATATTAAILRHHAASGAATAAPAAAPTAAASATRSDRPGRHRPMLLHQRHEVVAAEHAAALLVRAVLELGLVRLVDDVDQLRLALLARIVHWKSGGIGER